MRVMGDLIDEVKERNLLFDEAIRTAKEIEIEELSD